MATTIISRTQSGAESAAGRRTWTFSCWFKRSKISSSQELFGSDSNGARSNNYNIIDINSSNQIDFSGYESGITFRKRTTRVFTDTNAWYHLVIAFDSTQSTADDRIKIYINGVRETSFSINTDPAQDYQSKFFAQNKIHAFGRSSQTFDGIISHCHATEGTAYAPTVFGSTDSTTGEWKINTSPSVSYGTNGFFLFKDDNSVNNQAGNSSGNFAVTAGTLTKTEDCPSNVYATANPLVRNQVTITTANLTVRSPSSNWMGIPATMGVSSGKYYWEYKLALGNAWSQCGVMSSKPNGGYDGIYSTYVGNNSGGLALNSGNGDFYHDGSSGAYSTSAWFSGGLAEYDIIGVALDATNSKIWFSQNGTWGNSSNPSTGSGGIDFSGDTDFTNHKPYFPAFSMHNCILTLNFGNGYLGTAEITTNGGNGFQDADGNGRFYYAVPTNHRCLSTKGLNQ